MRISQAFAHLLSDNRRPSKDLVDGEFGLLSLFKKHSHSESIAKTERKQMIGQKCPWML